MIVIHVNRNGADFMNWHRNFLYMMIYIKQYEGNKESKYVEFLDERYKVIY